MTGSKGRCLFNLDIYYMGSVMVTNPNYVLGKIKRLISETKELLLVVPTLATIAFGGISVFLAPGRFGLSSLEAVIDGSVIGVGDGPGVGVGDGPGVGVGDGPGVGVGTGIWIGIWIGSWIWIGVGRGAGLGENAVWGRLALGRVVVIGGFGLLNPGRGFT